MTRLEAFALIEQELNRAVQKHPTWPDDPHHAANVVGEEAGEILKAVMEHTYEPQKSSRADVQAEAVETAAMAVRFLLSMDRYEFVPSLQHAQEEQSRLPGGAGGGMTPGPTPPQEQER